MGVLDFLRVAKKASPAAAITEMEASLKKLRSERAQANTVVESHAPRRAEMLLSDATEDQILDLDREAERARLRLERLELAEIELEDRIFRARDKDDREKRAAEAERAADAIAQKLSTLETSIAAFAATVKDFAADIPSDILALQRETHAGYSPAYPFDICRMIIAEGIFAAMPELFEIYTPTFRGGRPACVSRALRLYHQSSNDIATPFLPGLNGEEATFDSATAAAHRLIIARLRQQARELRAEPDLMLEAD